MIEKMKFISITGPKEDFDRVLDTYVEKHDIQLENALTELKSVPNLRPFTEPNPYKDTLTKINSILSLAPPSQTQMQTEPPSNEELIATVNALTDKINTLEAQKKELSQKRELLHRCKEALRPYQPLEGNLTAIFAFEFILYRFGRISAQYYPNFRDYIDRIDDTLFYESEATPEFIYGAYFVPATKKDRIDAVYASLHFETISLTDMLPDEFEVADNPFEAVDRAIEETDAQLFTLNHKLLGEIDIDKDTLVHAKQIFENLSSHFDVRKYAARLEDDFILCGWMTEQDANSLMQESEQDENIVIVFEDGEADQFNTPPTKLKNPRIFRPFQMFVRMYGLPAQNEIDPTIFVAVTYAFIFGWMFGDVGQGLVLMAGGFLLYKWKHMDLAAIIGYAGIFSTIFGFLFGSFFGFEDVLPALWLRPIEKMSDLPFIGKLNTVFVVAIAFGMCLNLVVMVLNIINRIRAKDKEEAIFHQNGVVGFVFYAALAVTIVLYMTGHSLPATIVLVIMFVVPLLLLALKEPICSRLEKKKKLIDGGIVMYIVQTFFELFEILLSYFSNTLSFVRIGAFAVSHAAMMEVVLMLAGAANGSPNWLVVVLGNLFVCGLEGLIVGIQVLRLEYYELFSRFYRGSGREFTPYKRAKSNS